MAAKKVIDKKVVRKARSYLRILNDAGIKVDRAYLYGSWARGEQKKWSDIDIAIISRKFSGNRRRDLRILLPLVRKADWRIEPMPFTPRTFVDENPLVWEIKKTGEKIRV